MILNMYLDQISQDLMHDPITTIPDPAGLDDNKVNIHSDVVNLADLQFYNQNPIVENHMLLNIHLEAFITLPLTGI